MTTFGCSLGVTDFSEALWVKGAHGPRMIQGICSTARPSVSAIGNNISLSPRGCFAKMPIPIYSEHKRGDQPIGEVVYFRKDKTSVYVRAIIRTDTPAADHAWKLIQDHEVRGFSVLASDQKSSGIVDGVNFISWWTLKELSLVRKPANEDCWFFIDHRGPLPC